MGLKILKPLPLTLHVIPHQVFGAQKLFHEILFMAVFFWHWSYYFPRLGLVLRNCLFPTQKGHGVISILFRCSRDPYLCVQWYLWTKLWWLGFICLAVSVSEVEALYEFFKKLSSTATHNGVVNKVSFLVSSGRSRTASDFISL
jgi:hypothetical protein